MRGGVQLEVAVIACSLPNIPAAALDPATDLFLWAARRSPALPAA
jgi:hypothetical protein